MRVGSHNVRRAVAAVDDGRAGADDGHVNTAGGPDTIAQGDVVRRRKIDGAGAGIDHRLVGHGQRAAGGERHRAAGGGDVTIRGHIDVAVGGQGDGPRLALQCPVDLKSGGRCQGYLACAGDRQVAVHRDAAGGFDPDRLVFRQLDHVYQGQVAGGTDLDGSVRRHTQFTARDGRGRVALYGSGRDQVNHTGSAGVDGTGYDDRTTGGGEGDVIGPGNVTGDAQGTTHRHRHVAAAGAAGADLQVIHLVDHHFAAGGGEGQRIQVGGQVQVFRHRESHAGSGDGTCRDNVSYGLQTNEAAAHVQVGDDSQVPAGGEPDLLSLHRGQEQHDHGAGGLDFDVRAVMLRGDQDIVAVDGVRGQTRGCHGGAAVAGAVGFGCVDDFQFI